MTDQSFYTNQNIWTAIYTRPISDYDRERTKWVKKTGIPSIKTILELGCGGGQFSTACAALGYSVTGLDIVPAFIHHAKQNIPAALNQNLSFVQADFYTYQPNQKFDLICYLDGFGVGSDQDQMALLQNIENWLNPNGAVILEVYTPWYWAKTAYQQGGLFGKAQRIYSFDPYENRMIDTWWLPDNPSTKVSQRLRCYAPADLSLLLTKTNLRIKEIHPGGAINYETGSYTDETDLLNAMSYITILAHG